MSLEDVAFSMNSVHGRKASNGEVLWHYLTTDEAI